MPITIYCTMIKRSQSRRTALNYTCKAIKERLAKAEWDYIEDPVATLLIHFHKSFADKAAAIQGRKNLDFYLAPYNWYCIDYIHED